MGDPIPTISVYDGKYTFRIVDHCVHIDRYDEKDWFVVDRGANAIRNLVYLAIEQRDALEAERAKVAALTAEVARLREALASRPKACPAWKERGGDEYRCEAGPEGHFEPHRFACDAGADRE